VLSCPRQPRNTINPALRCRVPAIAKILLGAKLCCEGLCVLEGHLRAPWVPAVETRGDGLCCGFLGFLCGPFRCLLWRPRLPQVLPNQSISPRLQFRCTRICADTVQKSSVFCTNKLIVKSGMFSMIPDWSFPRGFPYRPLRGFLNSLPDKITPLLWCHLLCIPLHKSQNRLRFKHKGQARQGRDLSTLAPLRALRARTPVSAWARRAVGDNRFARDLMVQEVGFAMLLGLGVTLIAADSPASFLDDGPTSKLIRQILGAVAEFDKAMTVAKLKGARDRMRRRTGKCEGRKSYAERDPALVAAARVLRAQPHMSLLKVSAALAEQGYTTRRKGCTTPPAPSNR
jgi:hypothetical protein